jgi:hypothetical protein
MSRETTLPAVWRALADALGGVGALAAECKVDPKTVWRWANEENVPSAVTRKYVDALAKRRGLDPPWGV